MDVASILNINAFDTAVAIKELTLDTPTTGANCTAECTAEHHAHHPHDHHHHHRSHAHDSTNASDGYTWDYCEFDGLVDETKFVEWLQQLLWQHAYKDPSTVADESDVRM